jgi:O-antigen/teichoic acid export membrane protein
MTQQVVGFLVVIILARKLAPEGYGQYSVILSLVSLVAIVANFGMNQVITREIALNPGQTRKLIAIILPIRFGSFLLAIIAFLIYFHFAVKGGRGTVFPVTAMVLGLVVWDVCESIAFGHFITKFSSALNIAFSVLWVLAIVIFPKRYLGLNAILVVYSLILISKSAWYVGLVRKKLMNRGTDSATDRPGSKELISMSLPYLWLRGIGVLVDQAPILILNAMSGSREVGYFSVGAKLILPISVALSTALRAMFPFMTKIYSEDKQLFAQKIKQGITLIGCLGTVIALLTSITSKYWIPFLFGSAYVHSVAPFNFLVWFGVILTADLLLGAALSSSYRQNALAVLTTIDVTIAMPIYYLGAMHGALGLSFAKYVLGLITLTYHWIVFAKLLKVKMSPREAIILAAPLFLSMAICFSGTDTVTKILLSLLLFGLYFMKRKSPFRESYHLATTFLFGGGRNA